MSGPKCDSFYVEDGRNELLRQAQRAEAERAARAARERLELAFARSRKAQQQLEAAVVTGRDAEQQFGATIAAIRAGFPNFPGLTQNSSVQDIERYVAAVEATTAAIAAEVDRAEGLAQLRSLIATSSQVSQVGDWSAELQEREQTNHSKPVADKANDSRIREEITHRIVGRLEGTVTDQEIEGIKTLVREIHSTTSSSRAESLETELRLRVQRANERIERARRDAAQASGLLSDLRGLQGSEVEQIREVLLAVSTGQTPSPHDLAARVSAVRERAQKRINDEYAGQVIREELERLGYSIGEEFSTLFVDGGQAIVCRPEQPEYGVQMQLDSARGLLDLAVVRYADSKDVESAERRLRDKNAEEGWCADHDKLRSAMRARGLNGRIIKRTPPGDQPVRSTKATRAQDTRRMGQPTLQQRELR